MQSSRSNNKERYHTQRRDKWDSSSDEETSRMNEDPNESRRRHHRSHRRYNDSESRARSRSPVGTASYRNGNDERDVSVENEGAARESLSIDETNKLRAQLGLAPLEVGPNNGSSGGTGPDGTKRSDVHAPPVNYGAQRRADIIKERLQALKEKRSLLDNISKGLKSLGEADDGTGDSVVDWVRRSRLLDVEKQSAAKRAQMLDEMDEEFGIGELLKRDDIIKREKSSRYDSENLTGLVVEHDPTKFKEGQTVILTLKDRGILDELDKDDMSEVLVNVNMVDDEQVAKSLENKKIAALGWERAHLLEAEDQLEAALKPRGVLDKYKSEIEGEHKKSFTLIGRGSYQGEHERMIEQLRAELLAGAQNLNTTEPRIASDFYTEEEMNARFKKRKRRGTAAPRRTSYLTADDLLSMPQDALEEPQPSTTTSREDAVPRAPKAIKINVESKVDLKFAERRESHAIDSDNEDLRNIVLEPDEAEEELSRALNQVRKLKQRQVPDTTEELSRLLSTNVKSEPVDVLPSTTITTTTEPLILNSTREYCRKIGTTLKDFSGDILLSTMPATVKEEPPNHSNVTGLIETQEEELVDEESEEEVDEPPQGQGSGWQEVGSSTDSNAAMDFSERPKSRKKHKGGNSDDVEQRGVLHDEPVLNQGLMCALQLASKRGYLEKNNSDRHNSGSRSSASIITAKNFVREEIRYDDIDAKFSKQRGGGGGGGAGRFAQGPLTEFRDKEGYKPDVRLEYKDKLGRNLNKKEAFRELSHRFHGKGSGKNKTGKRMRKIEEENAMANMSSSDTPLGSSEKLHRKLETEGLPYVILSGKNANMKKLSK